MIYLCGIGLRAGQMTLEVCAALKSCERIFCVNVPEETFGEIRKLFRQAEDATASNSSGKGFSEDKTLGKILSRSSRGKDVGVVFMGHPLLYSMAPKLIKSCRRKGLPYGVMAGLSSADCALATLEPVLREKALDLYGTSVLIYNAAEQSARKPALDRARSTVVLNLFRLKAPDFEKLAGALRRAYGPKHPAYLIECSERPLRDCCVQTTAGALAEKKNRITSRTTLILPMRRK